MLKVIGVITLFGFFAHAGPPVGVLGGTGTISIPAPIVPFSKEPTSPALMEVPKILDSALGEFKINDVTCTLNYAYSSITMDPLNEHKPMYEILLTTRPISARTFNQVTDFKMLTPQDQCWVYLDVENSESLNPIRAFIPGQAPLLHTSSKQTFIRKQMDVEQDVLGATLVFKEPLVSGPIKMTGKFSFRTQFRQLTRADFAVIKKGSYIDKPNFPAYQTYAALTPDPANRGVASVGQEFNSGEPQKIYPSKIEFRHAFVNTKEQKAVLVMQGTYTREQIATGMMIVKPESIDSDPSIFSMVLMSVKNGHWIKEREHWMTKLPEWALSRTPAAPIAQVVAPVGPRKVTVIPGVAPAAPTTSIVQPRYPAAYQAPAQNTAAAQGYPLPQYQAPPNQNPYENTQRAPSNYQNPTLVPGDTSGMPAQKK